jgi:hypothetical protein
LHFVNLILLLSNDTNNIYLFDLFPSGDGRVFVDAFILNDALRDAYFESSSRASLYHLSTSRSSVRVFVDLFPSGAGRVFVGWGLHISAIKENGAKKY